MLPVWKDVQGENRRQLSLAWQQPCLRCEAPPSSSHSALVSSLSFPSDTQRETGSATIRLFKCCRWVATSYSSPGALVSGMSASQLSGSQASLKGCVQTQKLLIFLSWTCKLAIKMFRRGDLTVQTHRWTKQKPWCWWGEDWMGKPPSSPWLTAHSLGSLPGAVCSWGLRS